MNKDLRIFLKTHERFFFLQFADTLKCAEVIKSKLSMFLQDVHTTYCNRDRACCGPSRHMLGVDGVVPAPESCCLSRVNGQIPCFQLSGQCFTCYGNKPILMYVFNETYVNITKVITSKLPFAE